MKEAVIVEPWHCSGELRKCGPTPRLQWESRGDRTTRCIHRAPRCADRGSPRHCSRPEQVGDCLSSLAQPPTTFPRFVVVTRRVAPLTKRVAPLTKKGCSAECAGWVRQLRRPEPPNDHLPPQRLRTSGPEQDVRSLRPASTRVVRKGANPPERKRTAEADRSAPRGSWSSSFRPRTKKLKDRPQRTRIVCGGP